MVRKVDTEQQRLATTEEPIEGFEETIIMDVMVVAVGIIITIIEEEAVTTFVMIVIVEEL